MNRLVIIGNGFDLAHGLPTSYRDFMDDFWSDLKYTYKEELYQKIIEINKDYDYFLFQEDIKSYGHFIKNIDNYCKENGFKFYEEKCLAQKNGVNFICFKNTFFLKISNESIDKWVDVENEYYRLLKEIANEVLTITNPTLKDKEQLIKRKKTNVKNLNKEFEEVKNILEIYLTEKVMNKYDLDFTKNQNTDWIKIYDFLKPISVFNNEQNVLKEFLIKEDNSKIKNLFLREKREDVVNKIYFLNFNYTPIATIYSDLLGKDDRIETTINFIHGEVDNKKENKINFGFGDEMDDDYKMIENINDNEYLQNFKSFQYLQNSNYSNLLSYIDSDKFQVVIMGHSCGLSDRTLLNTIFEHNNCRSIKVFYHQWKDEETDEMKDNYTEITQNISRHFNKKKLMREKIVNKTLCKPLPQIQLPKKE